MSASRQKRTLPLSAKCDISSPMEAAGFQKKRFG
jgi:hypothetical protein